MVDVLLYVRITFNSRKINIYLNGLPTQYVIFDTANTSFFRYSCLERVQLCCIMHIIVHSMSFFIFFMIKIL